MRIMTLAIAGMLAACIAVPADAAKKKPVTKVSTGKTFTECQQLALQRGVPPGQNGHREFVEQCMGGKASSGGRARGTS